MHYTLMDNYGTSAHSTFCMMRFRSSVCIDIIILLEAEELVPVFSNYIS